MKDERPPEGNDGRAEESGEAPMERFRNLTRDLLKVTPEEVAQEQRRYEERDNKGKRRPTLTSS